VSKRTKQAVVVSALAAALAVGVGVALAGGGLGFDDNQQAFLDDVAKRLDVTPTELKAALQGAYGDRLDAAVAAGTITKEQADAMRQHAKEGGPLPFGGVRPHGGFGHRGGFGPQGPPSLAAAATYLGLTEAELRSELMAGKTLAQIAKANDKSVDDLKTALAAESKKKLDAAVKAGHLTQAQADQLQAQVTKHLDDLVNGTGGPGRRHSGPGFGWGGAPPAGFQPPAGYVPVAPTGATV
jgi:hypothetical protein